MRLGQASAHLRHGNSHHRDDLGRARHPGGRANVSDRVDWLGAAFGAFVTLLAKVPKAWTWVQGVTVLLIATLAAELIYAVWADADWGEKILATNAILMTLGVISAWLLHVFQWLARHRPEPGQVMCPRCGKVRAQQPGDMECSRCSAVFAVKG